MNTERFIHSLIFRYPDSTVQDLCKALYQSCFGCGHFVEDTDACLERIRAEHAQMHSSVSPVIEQLNGSYVRLSLSVIDEGLSPETLNALFIRSARKEPYAIVLLEQKITVLKNMIQKKVIPLDVSSSISWIEEWKNNQFPPVSHSETYRNAYHPAYRVIQRDYVPYIPILKLIDAKRKKKQNLKIAIDGYCGSGKTTLGVFLADIYNANLFHVDDFFLQEYQRTEDRFAQPGGNFDRERLEQEVLSPLSRDEQVSFHWFDCSTKTLAESVTMPLRNINIIEGSYSMYPTLRHYYDVSVFVNIDAQRQLERIRRRNPEMIDMFEKKWIPLENKYFEAFDVRHACDYTLEN
ncbi:MAG: hypothetical protein ACI32N_06310 [Bulleidia sp.]